MPKENREKIPGDDVLEVLKGFIQQTSEHLDRIEKNMATKKDIEGVNARIDKVEESLGDVKEEVSFLGGKVERLEKKLDGMTNALQERMNEQEKDLRRVKTKIGMIA